MDETKSLSERRIKPKVGPLGGNALISRRAATWSPHLCLRHAEIVAENTLLRLSQETSSCSSHHRQQQVVASQHECVDVLCRGRAGTWDPDGKSANSIIHKGLPFPFFLCYKAQPVPSPLSPLSTVKLSPVCNVPHWPTVDFYVWAEVSLFVTDVHRTSPLNGGSWRSKSRVATSTQRPHWRYNHFQTGSRSPPPVQPKFLATSTLTL